MEQQEGITIQLRSLDDLATIIKSLNRTKVSYGVVDKTHDEIIDSLVDQVVDMQLPDTTSQ